MIAQHAQVKLVVFSYALLDGGDEQRGRVLAVQFADEIAL
jgi:hypothetical protein